MELYYSDERQVQLLISLLKAHGIKRVVASPGALNFCFVGSIQHDSFFEIYSCVDERSAAYMACGLAAETDEPIVLTCTGATASRNYLPGLTEAYYRHLPIVAITATQPIERIGHNLPQVIDRTTVINDVAKISVHVSVVKDSEDEWFDSLAINKALLELNHHGRGPVHINMETAYGRPFQTKTLPDARVIRRYFASSNFPNINEKKTAIFCGAHLPWSNRLTDAVDEFCRNNNAVVICDHTSNYHGKYKVLANLVTDQANRVNDCGKMGLLIHIGDVSGAYIRLVPGEVWRVNPDGQLCDTFRKLTNVFEMDEVTFFEYYNSKGKCKAKANTHLEEWLSEKKRISHKIPLLPFSNIWVAQQSSRQLPANSVLHLGILNSLRSWNYFDLDESISVFSNTGGFGIDGCVSTLIGAALVKKNKLFFGVVGDLAFFYDMNAIGNRHVPGNIRLIIINNGKGIEFRNYNHAANIFGEETDRFIAAAGHYGNKSPTLIKQYAESVGFNYLSASSEEDFNQAFPHFIDKNITSPMIFEIFTTTEDESGALQLIQTIDGVAKASVKDTTKKIAKSVIGDTGVNMLKHIIGK